MLELVSKPLSWYWFLWKLLYNLLTDNYIASGRITLPQKKILLIEANPKTA
jgi:hypothetical protein